MTATDQPRLEDIRGRLSSKEVRQVILALDYPPEIQQAKADDIIGSYHDNPDWALAGAWLSATLVGMIGLQFAGAGKAEIRHIAVLADHRHAGIGTHLVTHAFTKFRLCELSAETDANGVGFYRKRGFATRSLGEKYPGTERFWCTIQRDLVIG